MAEKKISKNTDIAAGFFSRLESQTDEPQNVNYKIIAPTHKTNTGGRPIKQGLKNEQFSLTMNPELYEKLRIIAMERYGGNFSRLIDETVKLYCKENNIDLSSIIVPDAFLEPYRTRQTKKRQGKANK